MKTTKRKPKKEIEFSTLVINDDKPTEFGKMTSLKYKVYDKYSKIHEELYRELRDLPEDLTKDFESIYKRFNIKIDCPESFDLSFRSLLWSAYYDMFVLNEHLPKDSASKVVALITQNVDAYPLYLLKFTKDKIISLTDEPQQIVYCINAVYKHLSFANINSNNLNTMLKSPHMSFTSFAFAIAGRLLELAIRSKQTE